MDYDISDDYEHINTSLEYVLENVLSMQSSSDSSEDYIKLKQGYNSLILNGCLCVGNNCNHNVCAHGKNYEWNSHSNELVLVSRKQNDLIYECNALCKCEPSLCQNRLVQRGPRKWLKIINSDAYGSKGLMTMKDIPQGGFICEYAGELLTRKEALSRLKTNEAHSMNYILCMNENITDGDSTLSTPLTTIVDPTNSGNIGRYLNHSCDPNCEIFSVRVDCPIPKVGIFAKRLIKAEEELCFHYNEGFVEMATAADTLESKRTPCLCRASICSGYLPSANM